MNLTFQGASPRIDPTAFIAPGCRLIGDIEIGAESSVWYNCVLRGDVNRIRIGARTNIQDGSVLHVDSPRPGHEAGHPTLIGDEVLIGHLAMVHGCILRDRSFVGLGAIVMDGCEIESGGMLAAGGLLAPGRKILAGQLWAGRPAKYVRDLSEEEQAGNMMGVHHYVALAKAHKAAVEESLSF
ncbi:MAG: gamma carbonic anhydrase family protein [Alphaproteobacteria bacterium]|nr:MAG: gamma carbonic anhydrase family protein [Alphaproteobacteria bacterium]